MRQDDVQAFEQRGEWQRQQHAQSASADSFRADGAPMVSYRSSLHSDRVGCVSMS